jgi:hypothetical protein
MTRLRILISAALLWQCFPVPSLFCREGSVDTIATPRGGFVIAPVVYYTPETRLSWGVVGIHYFRLGTPKRSARLSHYRFNFVRTQNKQSVAQVDYELYMPGDRILIDGMAKYSYFPDRFNGIGNRTTEADREEYTSSNWRLQLNLQRRWGDFLFAGLHLETCARPRAAASWPAAGSREATAGPFPGWGFFSSGTPATTRFPRPAAPMLPFF